MIEQDYRAWGPALEVGEGPIWLAERGLYAWIDIADGRLFTGEPAADWREVAVAEAPVCLASAGEQGLLVATPQSIQLKRWSDGAQIPLASVALKGMRFNDGGLDDRGRLWLGTLPVEGQVGLAEIYRLEPNGEVALMADGLDICNGVGFSPDNRAFYLADTGTRVIYRFDFDIERGLIGERRVLHAFRPGQGKPDGLAVDALGNLWVAMWDGFGVACLDPCGRLVAWHALIDIPRPTSIAFGGPDSRDIVVTSARKGIPPELLAQSPSAGRNLTWRVATPGRAITPSWSGKSR